MRRLLVALSLVAAPAYAQYNAGTIPPPGTITPDMLQADVPGDGECLTYDLGTLAFIWGACGSGGGAPADATYITQTHSAGLSAEQAMGDLGTGLVKSTTTTGVQSIYAGTSCTNQFPRSLDASGAATCASVADADLANNYSGVGSCSAGGAVTATVDNAGPTCDAHAMFDNEANTVTADQTMSAADIVFHPSSGADFTFHTAAGADALDIKTNDASPTQINMVNNGAGVMNLNLDGTLSATNYPSGAADDQVLVATSSTVGAWKTLPANALSYSTLSNSFSQAGVGNLAASTSADLAGVLSDEVGSGKAFFGTLLAVSGSNFTTTSTANQTITGLSWSGASGTNYWFRCNLAVTGTATGGPRISVTSSGSSTTISYGIRGHTTSATTQTYTGGSASGTQSASCTSSCLTADIPFEVTGMIRPSASVTLAIATANSTSGQTSTVKIGSSCLVTTP